jgi:pimeloyl-ACP methyl ester carboxylesterase
VTRCSALWEVGARVAAGRASRRMRDPRAALAQVLAELGPAERACADRDPRAQEDLLAFSYARLRAMTSVAGLRNDFRQFRRTTRPEPWPAGPDVPTLVLHGDADDVVPLVHGEHHRDSIPGAQLQVLRGAGHGFVLSMRRAVSPRIEELLIQARRAV